MSAPTLVVAGYCTASSAKLLAVFDPQLPPETLAHLHFEAAGERDHSFVRCKSAAPYSLALFELDRLPASPEGTLLIYSIDINPEKAAHTFHRSIRLLPQSR